jgi:hypothetical protein
VQWIPQLVTHVADDGVVRHARRVERARHLHLALQRVVLPPEADDRDDDANDARQDDAKGLDDGTGRLLEGVEEARTSDDA